jgi:hypothetical protein
MGGSATSVRGESRHREEKSRAGALASARRHRNFASDSPEGRRAPGTFDPIGPPDLGEAQFHFE